MAEQIGGQLAAGFVLTRFAEAPHHQNRTAQFMPGYFATTAVKPAQSGSAPKAAAGESASRKLAP